MPWLSLVPTGADTCVCVAVALLLACYTPPSSGETPTWVRPYRGVNPAAWSGLLAISKEAVRQRLAFVSGCYPPGRPTRGMLRQVFNHFVVQHGAGQGQDEGADVE